MTNMTKVAIVDVTDLNIGCQVPNTLSARMQNVVTQNHKFFKFS